MSRTVPSRAERVCGASARLLLLVTLLLMLTGQASLILGVALPGWEHAAILLDTLVLGFYAIVRILFTPRSARSRGGVR
ncbi:MAG TPA: hypothetical protein VGS97_10470 [Actinocrinis sp.]|uniref:hypothetical protein n=1 Tax=Actinocrinis sp. TaxID=1920516 RepID=UPI002DDD2777|nr:hypothetical protein [Actinocrinis sp.]HEV2344505.1 hypothetical protein [Actinocrinis sp.]